MRKMTLILDQPDHESVIKAMAERERLGPMADGKSNVNGTVLAEICRGWLEMVEGKKRAESK